MSSCSLPLDIAAYYGILYVTCNHDTLDKKEDKMKIEDKTGTLKITLPTLYGHILQHIEWGKKFLNWEMVEYDFRHCADVLREKLWRMKIEPIIESNENYCSVLHSGIAGRNLIIEWESIFNYQLWDAAVTYCLEASKNGGNESFSFFAIDLFDIIWRLRRDLTRAEYRNKMNQ